MVVFVSVIINNIITNVNIIVVIVAVSYNVVILTSVMLSRGTERWFSNVTACTNPAKTTTMSFRSQVKSMLILSNSKDFSP